MECDEMKEICILFIMVTSAIAQAATITYSYDKQYRLTQVKYSKSEVASYSYDAAGNLTLYVAVTDSCYLKSFLFFLSRHPFEEPRPLCWRDEYQPVDQDTYFG
ncbi:MAG: hypothetical protein EOM12_12090 [Verrucomicrobiae bacterium]|nr:hypothetical protein [Verrucomicrobiae bacterium]